MTSLVVVIGSPAIEKLRDELRILVLEPGESKNTRLLANRCLLDITRDEPHSDLIILISEASDTSLRIAAETIEALGPETFDRTYLADFFRACTTLYPGHQELHERTIGERYFIKRFIDVLDLATIEWLLDELTKDLACVCGKEPYNCDCRNGISKIAGSLLDRYFDLASPSFDPKRIWQWVENLNFHERITEEQSSAVKVLQEDGSLRQGIIAYVLVLQRDLSF